jgi:hypothetical protein
MGNHLCTNICNFVHLNMNSIMKGLQEKVDCFDVSIGVDVVKVLIQTTHK